MKFINSFIGPSVTKHLVKGHNLNRDSKDTLKIICFLSKVNKLANQISPILIGFQSNSCNITIKFKFIINPDALKLYFTTSPDFIIAHFCPTLFILCSKNEQMAFISV